MQRHRNRLQHSRIRKRHRFRQFVDDALRDGYKLGKGTCTAKVRRGNSHDLAVVAKIDFAPLAVNAIAAVDRRVERDTVTLNKPVNTFAHLGHDSRCFMAHHQRRNAPS